MFVWGLNTVALKVLVQYIPPLTMQSLRIFLAGLVLLPFLLWRNQKRTPRLKERRHLTGAILFGVVGHHSCLALGLEQTSATNAALILALVPLSTALMAMLFLGDRISWVRGTGILLGFLGVTFVVLQGTAGLEENLTGDLWVFGAMVSQAVSFIFIKKATETLDPKQVTSLMFLTGSAVIFLISLFLHPQGLKQTLETPAWVWGIFFASGAVASGLGHLLYNSAIHRLGPGQTAIFINLTPFFALMGSAFFLHEMIHFSQIAGFVLIAFGVFLGSGASEEKRRAVPTGQLSSK